MAFTASKMVREKAVETVVNVSHGLKIERYFFSPSLKGEMLCALFPSSIKKEAAVRPPRP